MTLREPSRNGGYRLTFVVIGLVIWDQMLFALLAKSDDFLPVSYTHLTLPTIYSV